jgi:hypothetical protein
MADALTGKTLRTNVFIAIGVSVICSFIAKILSRSTSIVYIPAQKHVVKEARNFNFIQKQVIAKFGGGEFPDETYIGQFKKFGINTVIIDFPGEKNVTSEWKANISNFIQRAKSSGIEYSFNIQFVSTRTPEELTDDMKYIHNNFVSDNYFKLDNQPFVVFGISSNTGSIRMSLKNVTRSGQKFFPCAIIDDRDLIKSGYEDGLECFMANIVTDTYSWSANPTTWESIKYTCDSRASLFIPAVQNVFKSAEHRRYEENHPIMDYPSDETEFTDDSVPAPVPPPPEGESEEDKAIREEMERRREEDRIREREERRARRLRQQEKPKDTRSDFHYAWDYAVKVSNIIVVQPQNNTNWILSDKDNFTETVENLTRNFLQ